MLLCGCASSSPEGGDAQVDATPVTLSFACATPKDCAVHFDGGRYFFCCVEGACVYGGAAEAVRCSDPGSQVIATSSYATSCRLDSDCVAVAAGDFCNPLAGFACPEATIARSALGIYEQDVARTEVALCDGEYQGCPAILGPCCRHGTCQMDTSCGVSPSDTLPACADAGGTCSWSSCPRDSGAGPPGSCADLDEVCCVP